MTTKAKQMAMAWISENEELLISVHDRIWRFAEVGLQENKTAKLLTDILKRNGFMV